MEILAVAVVVASIFMVIYSNFFPLKAELDNRVLYNDTEATYRAFYFKKILVNYNYDGWFNTTTTYLTNSQIQDKLTDNDKSLYNSFYSTFDIDSLILVSKNFKLTDISTTSDEYKKFNKYLNNLFGNEESGQDMIIIKLSSGTYAALNLSSESIYIIDDNNIITGIKGENSPNKNLSIPKSINGNDITGIGDDVFKDKSIESLKLANTITTIGSSAFENNKIKTLVIPSSVKTIGTSAFKKNDMKRLVINLDNITSIEESAFLENDFYKTTYSDDDNSENENFDICAPTIMVKGGTANQEFNWCNILGITEEVYTNITGRSTCTFSSGDILNSDGTKVLYHIISNNENYNYEELTSDQCTTN